MLALAYDDGPHTYTQQLVDMLDKAGVKGTFFWTGTLYGCIYKQTEAIKAAYKSGHQVASHTWCVSVLSLYASSFSCPPPPPPPTRATTWH